MTKEFMTTSAEETIGLGQRIGKLLHPGDVILLEADLAGGKTTLTKGIGLGLDVKKVINSPTFTIVKSYQGKYPLHHLDLYRLNGVNNDFDLEEYFNSESVCVVEWPHQVEEVLPKDFLKIEIFKIEEEVRRIVLSSSCKHYDTIIEEMEK